MTNSTHKRTLRRWFASALVFAVLVIGGAKVVQVTKEVERRHESDRELNEFLKQTPDQILQSSAQTLSAEPTKVVHGKTLQYSLEVPENWSIRWLDSGSVDIRATFNSKGIIVDVVATPGNLGSPEQAVGSIAEWKQNPTSPIEARIDGRRWLRFLREKEASNSSGSITVRLRAVEYVLLRT